MLITVKASTVKSPYQLLYVFFHVNHETFETESFSSLYSESVLIWHCSRIVH